MTIAVDLGRKATKQTNKLYKLGVHYSGIGTVRSALNGFLHLFSKGQIDICNSVLVKKFIR